MGKMLNEALAGRYSPARELLQILEDFPGLVWPYAPNTKVGDVLDFADGYSRREEKWAKERGKLVGSCFDGEPRQTLHSELKGNDTVLPDKAWARDGEFDEAEPNNGMETGVFEKDPNDPEFRHIDLENLDEEDFFPGRNYYERVGEEEASQEDREVKRLDEGAMAKAGANLVRTLGLPADDSMCDVVAFYLRDKIDGVIRYYFTNLSDPSIIETALEFVKKMSQYTPEVSKEATSNILSSARIERHEMDALTKRISKAGISQAAKVQLVQKAQLEQGRGNGNGKYPANDLGKALFGRDRFDRMLRS